MKGFVAATTGFVVSAFVITPAVNAFWFGESNKAVKVTGEWFCANYYVGMDEDDAKRRFKVYVEGLSDDPQFVDDFMSLGSMKNFVSRSVKYAKNNCPEIMRRKSL